MGYVYVAEADNGTVKIGASKYPKDRIDLQFKAKKLKLLRRYISEDISNQYQIEAAALKKFKNGKSKNEWVTADFDCIVGFVKKEVEKIGYKDEKMEAAKRLKINLVVNVSKSIWYNFRLVAESKSITKEKAFEDALSDYIKKHSKLDIDKLMEGT